MACRRSPNKRAGLSNETLNKTLNKPLNKTVKQDTDLGGEEPLNKTVKQDTNR